MSDRVIKLSKRKEDTREKNKVEVVDFSLDEIFKQFNENITNIKDKFNIADKLLEESNEESCKDIWQSQIVFLDSALDYYMHCITKYGMNKIFAGEWNKTEKYRHFMVPLETTEHAIKNSEDTVWFIELINSSYSKNTFMDASSIKEQFNLIDINFNEIADDVFYNRDNEQKTNEQLKHFLNNLYFRRNSIAHQSDRYNENGIKQEISKTEVEAYINNVNKIVNSIQNRIKIKNSK